MLGKKLINLFTYLFAFIFVAGIFICFISDFIFGADYIGDFFVYYLKTLTISFVVFIPLAFIACIIDSFRVDF